MTYEDEGSGVRTPGKLYFDAKTAAVSFCSVCKQPTPFCHALGNIGCLHADAVVDVDVRTENRFVVARHNRIGLSSRERVLLMTQKVRVGCWSPSSRGSDGRSHFQLQRSSSLVNTFLPGRVVYGLSEEPARQSQR